MIKKIVCVLFCFILLSTVVYADEKTTTIDGINMGTKENIIVYTLSLDDAIKMALTNNPQLNASIVKKEDTKIQLKAARETKADYRDLKNIPITTAYELVYIKNGYYVHTYENMLKLADYEYKQLEAQIAYKVTEKYYNLKNCERLLEISQSSYDLVLTNYNNASLSYDLGVVSKSELDSAYVSLLQAKFSLQVTKDNYSIAEEDFKISLNKNNEICKFVLTDTLDITEFSTNLEHDLIVAENSRYDITSLKANYDLAKEYLDLTLGAAVTRKSSAKSSFITAEYNYTNNKALILLGIKSSYNNITASRNNVTLASETLKLKKNAYNIATIQYEHGLITNIELLTAMNNMYVAEVEFENAKLKYRLSVDKYKYDVEIGI